VKHKNKKVVPQNIIPLVLILISIIVVFTISRIVAYSILVWHILPTSFLININGYRLHHFVYGNIIITVTSFLAIGLGIRKHKNLFAIFYGIGLGLVLDEFLLWMGNVYLLTDKNHIIWIPHSGTVVAVVSLIIATIIMVKLYELHKFPFKLKLR
jgi:hypothetical protein